ncbi:germin-like protein subfamily 1 member 7 isoform X2 [Cryptomeria japonica]|uniref:germin-like protein subfamily 1 member 7 isoform X2 n=1 Tax=Cryptomeria japonica TaxID=3369 RepID=UPI0025ABD923|nr:germin-like protein subfamily 1 member 7 isoform X2 [Cryptomeria japonica]
MRSLVVVAVVLSIMNAGVYGADPDPLTDFAPGLKTFTLRDIFSNGDVSVDSGGVRAATSVAKFPAAASQGLQYVRFKMVPCGVNLPHTHPRATEMLTLISGGPLQVGFVDTQAFIDILHPGDVTIFPRGTMHFEINIGFKEADYISALNSQNPGVLTSSVSILKLPLTTVATAFNITERAVKKLESTIYASGRGLKKTSKSGCVPGRDITVDF